MSTLDQIARTTFGDIDFAGRYFKHVASLMAHVNGQEVANLLAEVRGARARGSLILFFGNGGKAAISGEFANDLAFGVKDGKKIRAFSLVNNEVSLTALANDESYEEVLVKQLQVYGRRDDLIVALSGSGHSRNVIEGLAEGRRLGLRTAAIVGSDGGQIASEAFRPNLDVLVHVRSEMEDGPIEDVMMALCHLVVTRMRYEGIDAR